MILFNSDRVVSLILLNLFSPLPIKRYMRMGATALIANCRLCIDLLKEKPCPLWGGQGINCSERVTQGGYHQAADQQERNRTKAP
jgi:hypothetical protein